MKLLRNWTEIASIACPHTKFALANCEEDALLQKLAACFPQCFREGADDETDKFSWARILREAEKLHCGYYESRPPYKWLPYSWMQHDPAGEYLGSIPIFAQCFENSLMSRNRSDFHLLKAPRHILDQLRGMRGTELKGPMFLEHQGVRCVVGWIWFEISPCPLPDEGNVFNETDESIDCLVDLILVRADIIAFDC